MSTTVVDTLANLVAGDRPAARRAAESSAGQLAGALADYLAAEDRDSIYAQPAAFEAFIRGGGNVGLYETLTGALAATYDTHRPRELVDIGCGDGTALGPALSAGAHRPETVHLVEPSAALLSSAVRRLDDTGVRVRDWQLTVDEFVAAQPAEQVFDVVESTFALHTLPHEQRSATLAALRPHVGHLVLVEFDVPNLAHGRSAHLRFLADAYERGITEYDADRDLVTQGFLLPVLVGQLAPGAARATWEQPAAAWRRQLEQAGYTGVAVHPLHDYWWSPAVLLTACGGACAGG